MSAEPGAGINSALQTKKQKRALTMLIVAEPGPEPTLLDSRGCIPKLCPLELREGLLRKKVVFANQP